MIVVPHTTERQKRAMSATLESIQQSPTVEGWPPRQRLAALLCHASHHAQEDCDYCYECLDQADMLLDTEDKCRAVITAVLDQVLLQSANEVRL